MGKAILIAEDDNNTAELLARYFRREGFTTLRARDGREALQIAYSQHPRLVVLDLMMPRIDGWEVCEELRKHSNVPILILSARQEEADRLVGLSLGADDYVVKPFSPREVVARVHAILRRVEGGDASRNQNAELQHGELCLDKDRHQVTLAGEMVELTPSEFTLLAALMASPGRVLTREELLEYLYPGGESVIDRVVDVHIGKLRQKIETASTPRYIETIRGIGYRLG